jgi:hypothetical protein
MIYFISYMKQIHLKLQLEKHSSFNFFEIYQKS